jgi:hypothetical protein
MRSTGVVPAIAREGGVREWRLNKLNLTLPEATLHRHGQLGGAECARPCRPVRPRPRAAESARRTVMNFKLDIADSGRCSRGLA